MDTVGEPGQIFAFRRTVAGKIRLPVSASRRSTFRGNGESVSASLPFSMILPLPHAGAIYRAAAQAGRRGKADEQSPVGSRFGFDEFERRMHGACVSHPHAALCERAGHCDRHG